MNSCVQRAKGAGDEIFELYAFIIILTSTLVLGINYFVIITRPLHPIPVRKRGIQLYGDSLILE